MNSRGVIRGISRHLSLAITFELVVELSISLGALWAFAGLSEEVFEGETDRLDTASLLWIHSMLPAWLDAPLRLITALGYPRVVVPLLLLAAYAFYCKGLKLSATLLLVSVPGAAIDERVPVQLDGEPWRGLPVSFRVEPLALSVVC